MYNFHYNHNILRKVVVAFGNLFNDIVVEREDDSGERVQTLPVPIAYGPMQKFMQKLRQDPDLDRNASIQIPRMSFQITGLTYATDRKITSITRNSNAYSSDNSRKRYQYVGVPYDIEIELGILVKNYNDGTQILEKILPFFHPTISVPINTVPEMNLTDDFKITLNAVTLEDSYDGSFEERRTIMWTLTFTVHGMIYGPVQDAKVIKRAQIDTTSVSDVSANTQLTDSETDQFSRNSRVVVTPGLLANGAPTTNSSASIAYSNINADDDFGFAVDKEFYVDGKIYVPYTGNDE